MYRADEKRYEAMEYRRCGRSGVLIPRVSLGLWQNFGLEQPLEAQKEVLLTAFDAGITHFDLANNYGSPAIGLAETNFGKILKSDLGIYRDELFISTKAGYDMWKGPYGNWGSRKYLIASLDQSLKRMGLEYVDVFYHHRPDPETPLEETMEALSDIVRSGKALYVALSNYYEPETAKKALAILKENKTPCLLYQPRYNMLERQIENEMIDMFADYGSGIIAYSPLAQGVLTDKYLNGIKEGSRAAKPGTSVAGRYLSDPSNLEKIKKLNAVAADRGQTMAQMALAWILRKPQITSVLIGARNTAQLKNSIGCLEHTDFTEEELKLIEGILTV